MVQVRLAKVPERDEVRVTAKGNAGAEWVVRMPQVRVEIAYAHTVVRQSHMLPANRAIRDTVQHVVRK